MKYCDDFCCPKFNVDHCKNGHELKLRLPKSIAEAVYHNWGYVPKGKGKCHLRQMK